jgi:zinc protease
MSITRSALLILYVFSLVVFQTFPAAAQKPVAAPRQEKLLNGLKVLVWNSPASEKVSLKVRIHAGSAFDPQEKEGVMKLLADSLFPTPEARSFFKEELDGNLEVTANYDYIQVTAESRSDAFLSMLETVAQAITNPDLSKESTATLKTALSAQLQKVERDPAYVADRAVAKRLFGTFPYGRPTLGTPASLQKIDFADLRFAKDRLLTADNATIAIRVNVETGFFYCAV